MEALLLSYFSLLIDEIHLSIRNIWREERFFFFNAFLNIQKSKNETDRIQPTMTILLQVDRWSELLSQVSS